MENVALRPLRRASKIAATVRRIVKNKTKKPAHLFLRQSLVHTPCVCVTAEAQRAAVPVGGPGLCVEIFFLYSYVK